MIQQIVVKQYIPIIKIEPWFETYIIVERVVVLVVSLLSGTLAYRTLKKQNKPIVIIKNSREWNNKKSNLPESDPKKPSKSNSNSHGDNDSNEDKTPYLEDGYGFTSCSHCGSSVNYATSMCVDCANSSDSPVAYIDD